MGPLPVMFIVAGLLGGYTVHGWDVRQGLGAPHGLSGDSADLLVPFVFLLWWATADTGAIDVPYAIGIRTGGRNGGDIPFHLSPSGLQFAAGNIEACPAILEFDPATLVLTAYGRKRRHRTRRPAARHPLPVPVHVDLTNTSRGYCASRNPRRLAMTSFMISSVPPP